MITLTPSDRPNACQMAQIARKYGMFVHFGINTFYDTEWSNGKLSAQGYRPTAIDADGWVRNAYEAGMNFIVLTTKHHDGFCMWDTDTTDYCVNRSPVKTDVVAKVAKACEKYGIGLGLYYSLWDRHEKRYKDDKAYVDYMCVHLQELLGGAYGRIVELWLDGGWDKMPRKWNIPKLYDLAHTLQPDCSVAVNLTIGKSLRKRTPRKYMPQYYREGMPIRYFPSDFRLWDPHFPRANDPKLYSHGKELYYLPFEATICMRPPNNWFWDPKYESDKTAGAEYIAQKYRELTAQDNILVVNVAPDIHGKQTTGDVDCLLEAADILGIRRNVPGREKV